MEYSDNKDKVYGFIFWKKKAVTNRFLPIFVG